MAKFKLVVNPPNSELVPLPRSGHRCATDGVFLYVYGGFNPDAPFKLFFENIWCFHLSSATWHRIPTKGDGDGKVPRCVASSAMVLHKGMIIVFGGSGYPFGMHNSNETFVCNPRHGLWHQICKPGLENALPTPSYGQGVVMGPGNCLFLFGGTKGLVYNDNLHKLDLNRKQWEVVRNQNPPSPRYRHEMVGINGGFLVVGGYGENGACSLNMLHLFAYDTCSWSEVKCLADINYGFPEPRRAHSCVKFGENVYISGGYKETPPERCCVFDDIWRLNIRTSSWSKISQVLSHPTFFHSAAVTSEGCMYIFGGVEQINEHVQKRTNNVLKMWLVIPSLVVLSWDVFCSVIPPGERMDVCKLAQFGIPNYLLASYNARNIIELEHVNCAS